jgi:hypothetical protein
VRWQGSDRKVIRTGRLIQLNGLEFEPAHFTMISVQRVFMRRSPMRGSIGWTYVKTQPFLEDRAFTWQQANPPRIRGRTDYQLPR